MKSSQCPFADFEAKSAINLKIIFVRFVLVFFLVVPLVQYIRKPLDHSPKTYALMTRSGLRRWSFGTAVLAGMFRLFP